MEILKFSLPNCQPCKLVDKYAEKIGLKMKVIDPTLSDDNSDLAEKYGITSCPTIVVIEDDQVLEKGLGFKPSFLDHLKFLQDPISSIKNK